MSLTLSSRPVRLAPSLHRRCQSEQLPDLVLERLEARRPGDREYSSGCTEATAFATVFLEIPRSLAICAFETPSLRCSLPINAQSSKVTTFPSFEVPGGLGEHRLGSGAIC